MLEVFQGAKAWFDLALSGMAEPWVIALALILTTFLLEDLAIAVGAGLALAGTISWELAFLAVAGGIALGDFGLYGIGGLARLVPKLRHWVKEERMDKARALLDRRLASAILLARAIPGLRLPTYSAAGFVGVPFPGFALFVLLYVSIWTGGLFWFGATVGTALSDALGVHPALMVGLVAGLLAVSPTLYKWIFRRKASQ